MPDRIGNAALLWSATSDASGQRVHLLQAPLRALRAGHSMETFQRQSLDRSVLENVAVGDGSPEIHARVRYDHDAVGLQEALVAGSAGKTLRYVPELSDPDVDFDVSLVGPLAPLRLDLDPQRGILGDQSVELILRKTDQGSFDPLYHGTQVLFSYRAGGSLAASSSFGRVTSSSAPATFADLSAGGGFGNLSTALSNQARIHWMSAAGSCGPREFPTLLLEDSRKNWIIESEDLGSTEWVSIGTPVLSSGQADPYGGTDAWTVEDDDVAAQERIDHTFAIDTAGEGNFSFFLKGGDAPGGSLLTIRTSDGVEVVRGDVVFSSGVPSDFTVQTGTTVAEPERWRDDWWRLQMGSTGSISTGAAYECRVIPALETTDIGSLSVFGVTLEI